MGGTVTREWWLWVGSPNGVIDMIRPFTFRVKLLLTTSARETKRIAGHTLTKHRNVTNNNNIFFSIEVRCLILRFGVYEALLAQSEIRDDRSNFHPY